MLGKEKWTVTINVFDISNSLILKVISFCIVSV
jgi:hypothetical protein